MEMLMLALSTLTCRHSDSSHDVLYARYGDAVAQGSVAGGVGGPRQICPKIRKTLEAFTFQRSQPANKQRAFHYQLVLTDILAVGAFAVAAGQSTCRFLIRRLADQVCSILMLAGTLGGGHVVILEYIDSLAGEYGVVICHGQRISDAFLTAKAVSAILRQTVYGVSRDTERLLYL